MENLKQEQISTLDIEVTQDINTEAPIENVMQEVLQEINQEQEVVNDSMAMLNDAIESITLNALQQNTLEDLGSDFEGEEKEYLEVAKEENLNQEKATNKKDNEEGVEKTYFDVKAEKLHYSLKKDKSGKFILATEINSVIEFKDLGELVANYTSFILDVVNNITKSANEKGREGF